MADLVITPTTRRVTLTWDAVPTSPTAPDGDQVAGYEVRTVSPTDAILARWPLPVTTTTHILDGATLPTTAFSVVVVAVSKAGVASAPSNAVSFRQATMPAAPANLRGVVAWS
jgi:hypothetical protein